MNNIATHKRIKSQAGFTIVELMIAMTIFTVILLVVTIGVIQFTNSYYRGVHTSSTQTTTQSVIDTITQDIQFSSGGTASTTVSPSGISYFCAGDNKFFYRLGEQYIASNPASLGLRVSPKSGACTEPIPADISSSNQLLSNGMRVTNFTMVTSNDSATPLWSISIAIAYGDSDLLCNGGQNGRLGGCGPSDAGYPLTNAVYGADVYCRQQTGAQFCAVSNVSTVTQQRIAGS